jgi:hypothetical protein
LTVDSGFLGSITDHSNLILDPAYSCILAKI